MDFNKFWDFLRRYFGIFEEVSDDFLSNTLSLHTDLSATLHYVRLFDESFVRV